MPRVAFIIVCAVGAAVLSSCAQFDSRRGVEVPLGLQAAAGFTKGETTRAEVLDLLGPPSQVIALDDETALYYLLERAQGRALLLLIFNKVDVSTRYDRAIFFFDARDRLTDYAIETGADGDGR